MEHMKTTFKNIAVGAALLFALSPITVFADARSARGGTSGADAGGQQTPQVDTGGTGNTQAPCPIVPDTSIASSPTNYTNVRNTLDAFLARIQK